MMTRVIYSQLLVPVKAIWSDGSLMLKVVPVLLSIMVVVEATETTLLHVKDASFVVRVC